MKFLTDTWILYTRNLISSLRNPMWIAIGLFQPVLYLLLFAPLLQNLTVMPGFPAGDAYTVFTPGLLIMIALFGTAFAGFSLVEHIRAGLVERLLVTPTSRLAILIGYVLRDITVLLGQSLLLILIALPMGLTVSLGGLVATFALIVLIGAVMASCSYALALIFKDEGTLASTINIFTVPILLLSGIMLPLALAPAIIRHIASANPFSYDVTAARALFLGNFHDGAVAVAFVTMIGLAAVAFVWAARTFRRGAA